MQRASDSKLRKRLEALQRAKERCEEKKVELFKAVNRLKQDLQEGLTDEQRYNDELAKLGPSPQQIISDCNEEIRAVQDQIIECNEQLRKKAESRNKDAFTFVIVLAALMLFSVGTVFLTVQLTGFLIKEQVTTYAQEIGVNFTQPQQQYVLKVSAANVTGELRSLALSGKLVGEGNAKVYLQKGTTRFLVFDTATLQEKGTKSFTTITGRAVSDVTAAADKKAEKKAEKEDEKAAKGAEKEEKKAEVKPPQQQPVEVPVEKAINISLAYNAGTVFDSNDDGVELDIFAIDFTVAGSNFSWAADNSKLCTRWVTQSLDNNAEASVCHGSSECCALVELSPHEPSWSDPYQVFVGRDGATYNNIVSSQVIFANYSLAPGNVYSEIYYSSFATLPATFVAAPKLENVTENVTVIEFNNVCAETCSLAGVAGLNLSEYTLVIEVEDATLVLDTTTYTLAKVTEIDAEAPIVSILLPKNITYIETLEAGEERNTTSLSLNFTVSEPAELIWYVLRGKGSVTITANTTITAVNGTNSLVLFARDSAGNVGYDVVQFFVSFGPTALVDVKPPVITLISPLQNSTYNTSSVALKFTVNEPASVSYFLNLQNRTEITSNVTLAAEEGRNRLLLLATDAAGNIGSETVIFFVNTSNATINVTAAAAEGNVTPLLKATKASFEPDEDAQLEFEYIKKDRLVKAGKWKDEYEGYEEDYKKFLENVSAGRKAAVEQAVSAEKAKAKRKQVGEWVAVNETIAAQLLDSEGRKASIGAEIQELREGRFSIKLPKQRQFRAGLYTLVLNLTKDGQTYVEEQDFTWGVLAINTNKSIFLPNEDAFVAMAVLNNEGHMVCNADVKLTITDPAGAATTLTTAAGQITISPECKVYGVTNLPDYYTTYSVGGVGTYIMNLTAVTANGIRTILDNFTVQSSVDFDVARSGPTRIYPPVPYVMNFTIKANKNYNGPIVEYVPESFSITPQQGLTVTTIVAENTKALSWNAQLKKGDTINFAYEFDAPDVSPEFYLLGEFGIGSWKEARQWQVASDAVALTDSGFDIKLKSISIGQFVNLTGRYDTQSSTATCAGANLSVTENGVTITSTSNTAVRLASIDISNVTGFCSISSITSGMVNCSSMAKNLLIGAVNWSVKGTVGNGTVNTYTTVKVNGCAGTFNDANVTRVSDTTAPNISIVRPLIFANISGTFLINASINDSGNNTNFRVNATLQNSTGGNVTPFLPMKNYTLTTNQGATWNATMNSATVADGIYNVSVNATDAANNQTIVNTTVIITIDNTNPNATIVVPVNTSNVSSTFLVNASVNDTSAILNVTFMLYNETTNATNWFNATRTSGADSIQGYWTITLDSTLVRDGNYNITLNATDTAGNQLIINASRITIDNTAPNVTAVVPLNNTIQNGTMLINASVNNTPGNVFNATFILYNNTGNATAWIFATMGTGNISQGTWNTTFDTTTLRDANYNITVNATDFAGNQKVINMSQIEIDNIPNATIIVPAANINVSGNLTVNVSVNSSNLNVLSVNLTIYNNTGNATGMIPMSLSTGTLNISYQNVTFDTTTLRDGYYNLSVNATTQGIATNITANVSITIDNTKANVSAVVPANGTTQSGNMLINASVNDSLSNVFNATFRLTTSTGGTVTAWLFATLGSGSISQGYWNKTFDTNTVADDTYNITINATDFAGNQLIINMSQIIISNAVSDTTAPNVTIIVPSRLDINNTNVSGLFVINASVNDSASNVLNVNLTIYNNTGNATGLVPMNLSSGGLKSGYWNVTFNSSTLRDGFYNLSVNATDSAATPNTNIAANVSVTIDNTKANVTAVVPVNNTVQNGTILINASVNDSLSKVLNATFRLTTSSGSTVTAWLYATKGTGTFDQGYWNTTFDTLTVPDTTYNITVNATDYAGNQLIINMSQIEIDNIPNATIIVPAQNTNFSGNMLVNVSANSSNLAIRSVNLTIYNNTGNATGLIPMNLSSGSLTSGYWNVTFDTTTLRDASYNLSVNATTQGTSATTNITANVSITIDNTKANITAVVPVNNTVQNGTILINASVNDSLSGVFNATFMLYNSTGSVTGWIFATRGTGNITQGTWNTTFDTTTVGDNNYNITINATDFSGNQLIINMSQIEIDNIPNATIIVPAANINVSGNLTINVSANSSNLRILNVNLTIYNNTGNATGMIPMNLSSGSLTSGYWNVTFDTTTLRDASYNLSVNATTQGTSATTNITANVSITIDNTKPNATIVVPVNTSNVSSTFLVNASVNDTSAILNVTFRLYNETTNATNWFNATRTSGADSIQGYWTITLDSNIVRDATYNITLNATDTAGNQLIINSSRITIDNTIPNGTILSPANATNVRGFFTINASVNDTLTKIQNVSFRLRSPGYEGTLAFAALATGTTDQGVWNASLNSSTVANGVYNITLNASDFAGTRLLVNTTNVVVNNSGILNITFNGPKGGRNITQNSTFTVNATIACSNGYCQQVNGTVYYNLTSLQPSTRINATALDKPFHNVTTFVNQTCGYLDIDAVCSLNWTINATGAIGSSYFLSINFTSNNSEISQNGTGNFQINITVPVVTNTAPIVFNNSVALNGSVTLTEGGKTQFTVAFNITDADGTADIVNATVGVNITYNSIKRSNNSGNCQNLGDSSSTTNAYSCIVVFNYFDNSTTLWDINITAADVAGLVGYNDSQSLGSGAAHNLTIESLSAFSLSTGSVATTANINTQNNELSFVVNNTGNFDFTVLNVTAFNLNASLTDIFALNGNFSINATPSTSSGFGDNIANATPRNFTESSNQISATLPHKITSGEADKLGNRTLYIYIDIPVNKGLSSGVTYNSSKAWELFAS